MIEETKVRFEPFKEIVIRECNKFSSPEELARFADIASGGKSIGINWADGVAFVYYPIPLATETAAKAVIEEGRVYWAFVSYALMPEYKPKIETKERIIVPVVNVSSSPLFKSVAKWLKMHAEGRV